MLVGGRDGDSDLLGQRGPAYSGGERPRLEFSDQPRQFPRPRSVTFVNCKAKRNTGMG